MKVIRKNIRLGTLVLAHNKFKAVALSPMSDDYLRNNYPGEEGWILRVGPGQFVAVLAKNLIPLGQLPKKVWRFNPDEAVKYLPRNRWRPISIAFWKLVWWIRKGLEAIREIIFWKLEWPVMKLALRVKKVIL